MAFTEQDYLACDPFQGDEGELTCRTVKLVRARKQHPCFGVLDVNRDGHSIQPGELHRHEKALVDGDFWGSYRICLSCMDKWLTEIYPND